MFQPKHLDGFAHNVEINRLLRQSYADLPAEGMATTSTWTDIVDELRDLSERKHMTLEVRFALVDAASYIEILRDRLVKAERPWWRLW